MRTLALALLALVALQGVQSRPAASTKSSTVTLDTTYKVLIRAGDERPGPKGGKVKLGSQLDMKGRPIFDETGEAQVGENPDYTSYHKVGNNLVSIVQFETSPAAYYAMNLQQDKNGNLRVNTMQPIDISKWEGSVRPCAGSVTPYNTHMGGEENYPDVKKLTKILKSKDVDTAVLTSDIASGLNWHGYYIGGGNATLDAALKKSVTGAGATYLEAADKAKWFDLFSSTYKPYMIGHIFEIDPKNLGFKKHMALGRSSFETALIMPDLKTIYMTDDGRAGGFMKFVATKKGDWSKGVLYAGKFKQTNADNSTAGQWTLSWVKMADMDAAIVEAAARKPLSEFNFESIFLSADLVNNACPAGYTRIDWEQTECLKLNTATPNVAMLAAGLETRRFIPFVGATTEFSKMEGLAHDTANKKLYMAISYQRNLMSTGVPAAPGQDHIRVKENVCGCTYALDLDSNYNTKNMYPQVCGEPITVNGTAWCSEKLPANPDNLDMMDGFPWLIISEDSDYRIQRFMFMHNVNTKQNILVAAAESEAEVTSGWYTQLNNYSYITMNYQGIPKAPIGYMGPWKLQGVKSITFQPHKPKGPDYVNPYAPFKA